MPDQPHNTESLHAHPNLRTAAEIIGVSASTVSRREDLARLRRGERDVVIPPREVLRLAAIYRKRSLNDVAQDLVEHAAAVGPEEERAVEEDVERFFEENTTAAEREQLLRLAQRLLAPDLFEQVEESVRRDAPDLPDMIQGYLPLPES